MGVAIGTSPTWPAVAAETEGAEASPRPERFDFMEYEIKGSTLLSRGEIETLVYPFLGPDRSVSDVEKARDALVAAYQAKGYEATDVRIPRQDPTTGVIRLDVTETTVGRLRVRGARYFSPEELKSEVPALAEGTVPNFQRAQDEIQAANLPDRKVTATPRAGRAPGTIDVDLSVEDKVPLHGSLEFNNQQSQNTKKDRLIAGVRYDNLWQLGHSLDFSYQVAPERRSDSEVFAGSYLARFPQLPNLNFLVFGYRSKSDVASVGGSTVVGDGFAIGGRVIYALPSDANFFQSINAGVDYKNFDEAVFSNGVEIPAPVNYYPFTIGYSAVAVDDASTTQANANVVFTARGLGSNSSEFDKKRSEADRGFFYLRANANRTQTLPEDFQLFVKLDGQATADPLVSSEQIAAGGQTTVRGFLEAIALGDYGIIGTIEPRTPSLAPLIGDPLTDWRFYTFFDGAGLGLHDPLEGQASVFYLASVGVGTRIRLIDALNGSFEFAVPVASVGISDDDTKRFLFRIWGEI